MTATDIILLIAFCCSVAFCAGGATGQHLEIKNEYLEAVKHQAAHYDPKTGAFTWNQ